MTTSIEALARSRCALIALSHTARLPGRLRYCLVPALFTDTPPFHTALGAAAAQLLLSLSQT